MLYQDEKNMPVINAVLVAAGRSTRLGGGLEKQWLPLDGRVVLGRALDALAQHPAIAGGVIVVAPEKIEKAKAYADDYGWHVASGGETRAESVAAGLKMLQQKSPPDYVLIHDGARPFVPHSVIDRIIDAFMKGKKAVIPALPPADSLKEIIAGSQEITATIPRDTIHRAQTPQGFSFDLISEIHKNASDATDDSAMVEAAGHKVIAIKGDVMMNKITTADDLYHAELLARGQRESKMETRMATGFDTHRFDNAAKDGHIMLAGVAIKHDRGFIAHSDGDVALHAITDAIYGTMADGDIGQHFPPSDPEWKDYDSAFFLKAAHEKLTALGGRIVLVDLTIIAEEPKITPHRQAMRQRLVDILGLNLGRISIKATTTEGLGYTGRGEGIAAQAAVTVTLPFSDGESL